MSKRESISRYHLIIKKLRKRPATYAEIADCLALESELQGYNFNVSQRTFQRDLDEIRALYNIDIQYNFSDKVYSIVSNDQFCVNERMLEAFDTFNALNISDRLSAFIHFENRKPQGTKSLNDILHAIENRVEIRFTYRKYWEGELSQRILQAFALKEFKNRWYVLGRDLKDNNIKSFALDRLSDLEICRKKFDFPEEFDLQEYFKYSFGIMSPNAELPEEVVLSFDSFQGNYIKSLPLHSSQEILIDNEEELRIALTLFITHDFFMEILSFGESVRVLQPEGLIRQLRETVGKLGEWYG